MRSLRRSHVCANRSGFQHGLALATRSICWLFHYDVHVFTLSRPVSRICLLYNEDDTQREQMMWLFN